MVWTDLFDAGGLLKTFNLLKKKKCCICEAQQRKVQQDELRL